MLAALSGPVLSYDNVRKSFGETVALRGITLAVEEGEVLGLLGPNGAGKTTLIRIGLDIIRPDSGDVALFGAPLNRDALERVAYLPEERGMYKKMLVLDALVYFARLKGMSTSEAKTRGRRWLAKVGLADVAERRVETLSKGMTQKIQIAGALMTDPELVVLDEPFSGLDPVNTELVKNLIEERRSEGRSTILSTHMMNQVELVCDRVALVNGGELMVYGELNQVRQDYSSPEARIQIDGELPELEEIERVTTESPGVHHLAIRNGHEPPAVLAKLIAKGAVVRRFEEVIATMDEIFIRVVKEAAERRAGANDRAEQVS